MKNFKDRIATPSNQYRLTPTDKDGIYIIEFSPDEIIDEGTPINRITMMAVQGFCDKQTVFNDDGSITETNNDGDIKLTTFNDDGSITETIIATNGVTISKMTIFNPDGSISESLL